MKQVAWLLLLTKDENLCGPKKHLPWTRSLHTLISTLCFCERSSDLGKAFLLCWDGGNFAGG